MAGIGFELRKLLRNGSLFGLLRAYGFAGFISSGPWVFSIFGVMITGVFSVGTVPAREVEQYLISVTYLMASSLILTGWVQLLFSRFVADRLFEGDRDAVLPNLLGALTLTALAAGAVGAVILAFLFREPVVYRLLMLACFVTLCQLWIVVVLL